MDAAVVDFQVESPRMDERKYDSYGSKRMNHMSAEIKLVHARLERWGSWARASGLREWPASTILAKLIEQGPNGAAATSGEQGVPEDIMEVDAAVARLGQIDGNIIRTYYLEWAPIEVMAKNRRVSVSQFNVILKRARWRIEGFLAACEKNKLVNTFKA